MVDAPANPKDVAAFLPRLSAALMGDAPLLPLPAAAPERERLRDAGNRCFVPTGVALVVPTSGSTGIPRLALLSAAALLASADRTHEVLGGRGHWLLALPTTHIAGLQVLVRSLRAGLEPVVVDTAGGFNAADFSAAVESMDIASSEQPHYTALVPTQLQRLLDDGAGVEALWQLDAVLVGGAAAPDDLLSRASAAGINVISTYGMTETCAGCVYDGVPLPDVNLDIAADGRIRVAGPMLFDGYAVGDDSLTDGWFTTSDLGRLDDGVLHVQGRADNVIVSGGVNVPAEAVERVLLGIASVTGAVVVGVPDSEWGERVVAVVTAGVAIELSEVRSWCLDAIPHEWLPREVLTLEAIPMLPSGKPDRTAVRHIAAKLAR
ncbi:MAG: o-succinylbenzoate--CoA ligase [Actinomycetia bacterium]|nr:o-succinylbenzoate--CoA ligase [Actinomycetes bacterium]